MKIINLNLKKGEIKLTVENLDDLWYLSTILEPGDLIKGSTLRKIKLGEDQDRKAKIIKKPVYLKLETQKIEFSKTSDILRASGKIKEGPEDISLDSYHTFNISKNTTITIIKDKWLKYQLDKLKEASSEKRSRIMVVVLDREEAIFAIIKRYGYEILSRIEGDVQKKADMEKKPSTFYSLILKQIKVYDDKYQLSNIILASPAFWKEEALKELKDQSLKKKIIPATCSSVGKNAIDEVLRRPETRQALALERASEELNAVEELLSEISKDNLGAYGLKETEAAVNSGAVKKLLITDSLILKSREEGNYSIIENLLKTTENTNGKILIISSEHEGGKKLDGIGGIGAILRYKLQY